uniref:max dimerization protein 1-like n=1 Tax=Styela clava TaxID=7725 RepID=UPI00193AD0E8|nr:max dimerization protein 1-like [Styela clava]
MLRSMNASPTSESDDDTKVLGLELLIEAANYLEKCDSKRQRESDHGYASTFKYGDDEPAKKRLKSSKKSQSRTSHNELEKNRRAHLRNCLDNLKSIVPLGSDSNRHTTLGLLKKATSLIKDLEGKEVGYEKEKDKLGKYNEQLKQILFRLEIKFERLRRDSTGSTSLSECSNDSDKDEIIDVLDTSCSSSDELIQVMTAANNDANGMLISMPEILIVST